MCSLSRCWRLMKIGFQLYNHQIATALVDGRCIGTSDQFSDLIAAASNCHNIFHWTTANDIVTTYKVDK